MKSAEPKVFIRRLMSFDKLVQEASGERRERIEAMVDKSIRKLPLYRRRYGFRMNRK